MQRILDRYFPESISDRIKYISKDKLPPFFKLIFHEEFEYYTCQYNGFFNLGLYYKKSLIRKKDLFIIFIENLLKGKSAEITLCNADGADGFYYDEKTLEFVHISSYHAEDYCAGGDIKIVINQETRETIGKEFLSIFT